MKLQKVKSKTNISLAMHELKHRKFTLISDVKPDELESLVNYFGMVQEQYGVKYYIVNPTTTVYSANSAEALYPHSDLNETADNDVLVGLYTEVQDRFPQGGYTGICDMTPFFDELPPTDLDYLLHNEVTIVANSHLKKMGAAFYHGPMLSIRQDGSYSFRFSYNFTQVLQDDTRFISLREEIVHFYHEHKITVKMPKFGLLLFNNSVCLHDRSNIYDLDRTLYRFYVK